MITATNKGGLALWRLYEHILIDIIITQRHIQLTNISKL